MVNNEVYVNKLEFIENYFYEHYEDDFFYVVLHSLFNCISDNELKLLYFQNAKGNPILKKTIESYIVKRTINEPKRQFENIAKTLLNLYPEQDYKIQVTTRTFLTQFIRTLSKKTIRHYFDLLIHSERKYDRHRANEVADLIWSDEIEGYLTDNFYNYKDEYSLLPLIKNLEESKLCVLIENYWTKDFPSPRLKNSIIKKIAKLESDYYSFLKERDVSFYIQVLYLKKIKITENEIKQLLEAVTDENKFYLIWNIGMTGDWKQTVKYIDMLNSKKEIMNS
ncbi:MAG: hypothetical protein A3K10_00810 [Bacteroidetes bacterium RIFCSPLOWO2_12_FULL_31_6]|nr:MAG: hypothetical protein A3K10_00810 [Bacteroidetes bacterium RIFCSPLOWO2_12_FULL_31_6]